MPKVSIILPVYNQEKYVKEALDSCINQTLKDIEIICVNDCSTDNTLNILNEYANSDNRIKIINLPENKGPGYARNRGIEHAQGEYIMFLDPDDWYELEACEEAYDQIKQNHNDYVIFNYSSFFEKNKKNLVNKSLIKPFQAELKNPDIKLWELNTLFMVAAFTWSQIYRKDFIINNDIKFDEERRNGEDAIFYFKALSLSNSVSVIDKPFYNYRIHKNSTSLIKKNNRWKENLTSRESSLKLLSECNHSQEYLKAFIPYYIRRTYYWFKTLSKRNPFEQIQYYNLLRSLFINLNQNYNINEIKKFNRSDIFKKIVKYNWFQYKSYVLGQKLFSIKNEETDYGKYKVITILFIRIGIKYNPCQNRISSGDKTRYIDYVLNHQLDKSSYIPITDSSYKQNEDDVKLISFYLPQFHDFKENLKWFGRGFSEWSNTSKTVPQYIGHNQPHIPIDVGYYTLENNEIMKRQIELAKMYGIYGFSFYYYWFSGEKLMEKPLERFLADKSLNMPFFLFWANEDWTMLWDNGKEKEVLHKHHIKEDDADKFMADALPYFKDERYIKIDNKPLLIIYDATKEIFEKYENFNKKIRQIAKDNGFDDLYILTTSLRALTYKNNLRTGEVFNYNDFVKKYNMDGIFEFFPQGMRGLKRHLVKPKKEKIINKKFNGLIYNMHEFILNKKYLYPCDTNLFKGCFPNWDNTARKCYNGALIYENTPEDYKTWLKDLIKWTKDNKRKEEQFVFINAWNEWAEGAHLEPDQHYGYAYLQATKEALEESCTME